MNAITLIGFVAVTLTTMAFLPQVIQVWRTRSTKDISLVTFVTLCAGIILWITYGVLIDDAPLIIGNAITLVLAGTILGFKIKYK
ncbi:MAG: SemiSWEET transporter [Alphaproteobacteria bacterium]|jgi:MtN3 and saliva related transmembrane protein|nr:SemiSWEET transporter [Alphaproteobacteria bacterium]MBT7944113.1 SemiSWEET transporter [Alphaproteobacteria bacterium]